MIDCIVTKGWKPQRLQCDWAGGLLNRKEERGQERKKESNPNRECFLIKNVGLDDKSGSGMRAVSAFVMGGNGAHPLVCFGLGNWTAANDYSRHEKKKKERNPPSQMPHRAGGLTFQRPRCKHEAKLLNSFKKKKCNKIAVIKTLGTEMAAVVFEWRAGSCWWQIRSRGSWGSAGVWTLSASCCFCISGDKVITNWTPANPSEFQRRICC